MTFSLHPRNEAEFRSQTHRKSIALTTGYFCKKCGNHTMVFLGRKKVRGGEGFIGPCCAVAK